MILYIQSFILVFLSMKGLFELRVFKNVKIADMELILGVCLSNSEKNAAALLAI